MATESKAEAARNAALLTAVERRTEQFEDAQTSRRAADTEAVAAKRRAEDAANRKYEAAIADLRDAPRSAESGAGRRAEARRGDRSGAPRARQRPGGIAAGVPRRHRRGARRRAARQPRRERAYLDAITLGATAARGAKSFADQALAEALAKVPEARGRHRGGGQLTTILTETSTPSSILALRRDLESVKTYGANAPPLLGCLLRRRSGSS